MSLRTIFTILAVILLVGQSVSVPRGKHRTRTSSKPVDKISGRPPVKVGGKGGVKSPVVQQKKDNSRVSLPLDILPYHYTVSIVPDLDNSTFFGEVSIDFEAARSTQEIVLHATNLQIDYDKLVLTERRCIPPNVVEVTSTAVPSPSTPSPEYVAPPSAAPAPPPEYQGTQSQTSQPESPIYPEQSSGVTDKGEMPSPATEEALAMPEKAPAMSGEAPALPEKAPTMPEEAPAMSEEAPAIPEEAPAMPEEAPAISEEAPAMPEEAPAMPEKAPAMPEEAPAMPEEAPAISEEAPAMPEEAPAMPEKAPAMPEEAPAISEEAPAMPEEAPAMPEKAPAMPEEAPAMAEEAPDMPEEATPMEEASAPVVGEAPVEKEEAPVESEKISPISMDMSQQGAATPEASEVPATHEKMPTAMNESPSMPEEAPVPHEESPSMTEEAHASQSLSEVALVVPEKAEVISSYPAADAIMQPEPSTVEEQPAETTTVKDTFNLAGEALKILEVLNRSDIPPFIKANLTDDDDDDMVNLTDEDGVVGQDKIDHYMDKLEIRTDDLAIEDCQKVEVIQPPPSNFQPPPPEDEEGLEQTTSGIFNSIRTALDKFVQTTLTPLAGDQSGITNIMLTSTSTPNDKSEILRIIDKQLAVGMKNSGSEITTEGKSDLEITTVGKTTVEVFTDGKSTVEITTNGMNDDEVVLGKSGIPVTTEGNYNVGSTSNEKLDVQSTTDGKFERPAKADIVSTTYKTETVEPLLGKEQGGVSLSNPETTPASIQVHDSTDLPINLGTEWSVDSSESLTTDLDFSPTEKSKEVKTEYPTTARATNAEPKKSRNRRAAPKRKKRPTNRNKLKQSIKLPTCTSEDLYEVRVDKALSPSKKIELENADIGVEIANDKIRQEENDFLVLPTKIPLQAGKRYRLTVSFSGKMARRPVGLYRSDYVVEEGGRQKSKYVATTVLEPIHARRVFPCLDDPRFRARFSMRIAHPPNLSAYSNMPASTTSDDVDSTSSRGIPAGWLWDRFETTPPMPTYLVAFFVGALARKSRSAAGAPGQNDLMIRVLARRERLRDASFALNLAPKVMLEMGQWLNKPTSLRKLDLLALPGPGPDAVENWGLVSFQERYLLTQPGLLSRFSVASVLSHELAHDWFGNLVTPHHWKYAWLSEGLATYSSAKILNKIQPTWDVEDLATVAAYIAALDYSDDNDAIPMQPKKISSNNYRAVFSPASYYRGYMTMRMLKGIIGDEMLTASLQLYVQQNEVGWAKSSRLWAAVNETAKEQNITLDIPRSLSKVMSSWIEQPGYPLVTITRNYTTGEVYVQQERYRPARSQSESNATWWIPLRTWTAKTTGAMLQWLPASSKRNALRLFSPVPIGGDQWLMANAEFAAPFRVQYDVKNWDLLAAALPNGELPRGAGAQLSVDALSLASDGQLPFSVALKVVSAALGSRTGDAHLTWTAASPSLRRIDRELRSTKASRPYRQWLHRLITPLDTWISFDARNDTVPDAVLARHVTTAACSLAMPLCLTTGRSQFRTWMASNTPEPRVPIELRGTLYCAAVRDGSSDTVWRYLWSKISTVPTDEKIRILKGLGCTRDPELAKRLLQLTADVKSPVYKKQLPTIVRSIAMHDSGPGVVLSFFAENIQRFGNDTKTLGRLISEVAPVINSKKDMKKLQGLLPQITTSRTTMAKVFADATASMERSQRLSQAIFAYFNKSKKQT